MTDEIQAADAAQQRLHLMASLVNIGLRALGTQALTFFALILDAVMFGWAMIDGTWQRIAAAVLFAIATWCLVKLSPLAKRGDG